MSDMPPPPKAIESSNTSWAKRRFGKLPVWAWIVIALVLIGVASSAGSGGSESESDAAAPTTEAPSTDAPATEAPVTEAPTTTARATTTTTTEPPFDTIESGTYIIGTEIQPGFYRVAGYWSLLDESFDILENDGVYDNGLGLVRIPDSGAKYIEISGEAVSLEDAPVLNPITGGFTEGTYLVNIDIAPGTYRVSKADGAYAARLALLPNGEWDIIDNELNDGNVLIRIEETDAAFQYSGTLERVE